MPDQATPLAYAGSLFGSGQGFQSKPVYYAYGNQPFGGATLQGGIPAFNPREQEFFSQYPYNVSYPYGSPAQGTAAPEGVFSGGRTSAFFGPSGVPYSELQSSGDREYQRIIDSYNRQRQFSDIAYGQFRNVLGQQLGTVQAGFAEAQDALSQQGQAARQRALDRESQLAAELSSRSGGFGDQYAFNRRGLADATTRQLASIDEGIGRLYSDLALSRTSATTNVLGSLGQSYLAQADDYLTFLSQERSLLGGYQPNSANPRDYSGLYNLLGSVANIGGYVAGKKIEAGS